MTYAVYVSDNFHYQDESHTYKQGEYETYEQALTVAKAIVDDFLVQDFKAGMSAKQLYERYRAFGEDPRIVGKVPGFLCPRFSAWRYAKQRCSKMCRRSAGEFLRSLFWRRRV